MGACAAAGSPGKGSLDPVQLGFHRQMTVWHVVSQRRVSSFVLCADSSSSHGQGPVVPGQA